MSETKARAGKFAGLSEEAPAHIPGPISQITGKRRRGASFFLNALSDFRKNVPATSSDELKLHLGCKRLDNEFSTT